MPILQQYKLTFLRAILGLFLEKKPKRIYFLETTMELSSFFYFTLEQSRQKQVITARNSTK